MTAADVALELKSLFLAPWCLPNEVFPIHAVWTPFDELDEVVLEVPADFALTAAYSILDATEVKLSDGRQRIVIRNVAHKGYLAIEGLLSKIAEEEVRPFEVTVRFSAAGKILHEEILRGRVERPVLVIHDAPNEVELKTGREAIELEIHHTGRAGAQVSFQVETSGQARVESEELVAALVKKMAMRMSSAAEKVEKRDFKLGLNPDFIEATANRVREVLKAGGISALTESERSQLLEFLENQDQQKNLAKLVHSEIEDMWVAAIVDSLQRNPTETVQLEQGPTSVLFEQTVEQVQLEVAYSDHAGNKYEPLKATVAIKDSRAAHGPAALPIKIKWRQIK